MSFSKEKTFLLPLNPLTPLSKKQKVTSRHGCLQEEGDAGGKDKLAYCCMYLQELWFGVLCDVALESSEL